jgi:hypothetical protein
MHAITDDQADLFRTLRPSVRPVFDALGKIAGELCDACPHLTEDDPDCWVCLIYRAAANAQAAYHNVPDWVDGALVNGPHPRERKKD